MQSRKQTDLILLDFSKAFDKVSHENLLQKLHCYGIRGDTLLSIKTFWIKENSRWLQTALIQTLKAPIQT